jgi:hypothetical protein
MNYIFTLKLKSHREIQLLENASRVVDVLSLFQFSNFHSQRGAITEQQGPIKNRIKKGFLLFAIFGYIGFDFFLLIHYMCECEICSQPLTCQSFISFSIITFFYNY